MTNFRNIYDSVGDIGQLAEMAGADEVNNTTWRPEGNMSDTFIPSTLHPLADIGIGVYMSLSRK